MSTILHWIRAVANAPLSPGCKGFCLELIPQMNSSSLSSNFSTGRMASKVSAAPNSVKVYRAQLQKAGLLKKGQGWHLQIPGGEEEEEKAPKGVYPHIPENPSSHTHIYQDGIPTYTKGVYPHIPPLYKGTSTSVSTSVPTNTNIPSVDERLLRIRKAHRPDVGERTYDASLEVGHWLRQWKEAKGRRFPWSNWAGAVLPYLREAEREELLDTLLSIQNPNLRYATAIVTRMCSGAAQPSSSNGKAQPGQVPVVVAGRSEDDDLWLEKISS